MAIRTTRRVSDHHHPLTQHAEADDALLAIVFAQVLGFKRRAGKDHGCIIFNHQDPANFYYAHLGAKPDPASGQIMIVQNAPRRPLTQNTKTVPWTDQWHQVKVVRDVAKGTIEVFFDDMTKPQLSATDKTFGKGRIGIGSFDDMNDFDDVRLYARP